MKLSELKTADGEKLVELETNASLWVTLYNDRTLPEVLELREWHPDRFRNADKRWGVSGLSTATYIHELENVYAQKPNAYARLASWHRHQADCAASQAESAKIDRHPNT